MIRRVFEAVFPDFAIYTPRRPGEEDRRLNLARARAVPVVLLVLVLSWLAACGGPAVPISGQVTDAYTGQPVSDAKLTLGEAQFTTDSGGRFQIASWDLKDTLQINAPGYEPVSILLQSQPQLARPALPAVTLDTTIRPNTVSGVVTESYTGKPVGGATVRSGEQTVTTGADGRYTLSNVPESFALSVSAAGHEAVTQDVARTTSVDVALRPNVLSGVVTDRYTGKPVAGATVRAGSGQVTTGADGTYRIENVAQETTLEISAPGYAVLTQPIARTTSADAVLRPDLLRATLIDQKTRAPIRSATVIATAQPYTTAIALARIDNSPDGTFTLEGIPEQGYIQVLAPGYRKTVLELKANSVPPTIELEPFQAKAIYITAAVAAAGPKLVNEYLDLIDQTELNALVVDLKSDLRDDLGLVYYDSQVPIVKELNTARPYVDMKALVDEAKRRGIYVIARVQLFSHDNVLADARPDWAVKDLETGEVFADYPGPGIRYAYLDPFNKNVWDYNIQLGIEAALMGFDEINYDYVRFSDWYGKLSEYNKKLGFSQPVDPVNNPDAMFGAITGFMEQAHKQVNGAGAYFSVDVFGRTMLGPSMPIGQDIARMAQHADFVCPMPYPSLWWPGYLDLENPTAHPYEVILNTLKSGDKLFEGKYARVRPWLQDHTDPWQGSRVVEYGPKEVRAQIDATEEFGKAAGWLLYDSANAYKGAFNGAVKPEP